MAAVDLYTRKGEKELLDILRFPDKHRVCRGRKRRSRWGMVTGRGSEGERVKACTGTKDHEEFLEIGLYAKSKSEKEKERKKEIEKERARKELVGRGR